MSEPLIIDCDTCVGQHTPRCDDCVVSHLLGSAGTGAVVIEVVEARALRRLARAGLAPELRHEGRGEGEASLGGTGAGATVAAPGA
jgi:hypothetical protein